MRDKILLSDIIKINDPKQYKLHLACWNGEEQPLDVFIRSWEKWVGWNEWKGNRNDWTCDYIFSLINFYPKSNSWLFGGVFKVKNRFKKRYEIEECLEYKKYVGRLILSFYRYPGLRGRAFNLENHIDDLIVSEILPQVYEGEVFPGYDKINHDFSILEAIIRREKIDWKTALQNVKGIYLITDKSNGKSYVGAAYGNHGIWSRWQCYIGTGHGWNDELIKLITEKGIDYARTNFKIALLEIFSIDTPDEYIISRENRWKTILMTREHGYNKN
jgi:hypothetical protein